MLEVVQMLTNSGKRLVNSQTYSMATKVFHLRYHGPLKYLHRNHHILNSARVLNPCVHRSDVSSFHLNLHSQTDSQTFSPRHLSTLVTPISYSSPRQCDHFPSGYDRFLNNHVCVLNHLNNGKSILRPFSTEKDPTASDKPSEREGKDPQEVPSPEDEEKKLTLYQRFKKTYKEHGKVLVTVHLLTSAVWFGSFYTAARCGIDIVPFLESWNLSEKLINPFRSGGLGDIALAYLMYKLATPARYTVTIGGTNLAIRYLRKEGKMEPVAKEDTLRAMYNEGKADLKNKGQRTRGKIRSMRGRMQRKKRH